MPAPHPEDIIRPGENEDIFNLIIDYYNVSSFREVPKNSIKISKIKFYEIDSNSENDYLIINFINNRFHSWNKVNWIQKVLNFFKIKSFKLKRSDYDFLWGIYVRDNENEEPVKLQSVYCVGKIRPFVIFFFELLDGPGTEGNSVGIKVPRGGV